MAWQPLGSVNLTYDWQFLALSSGNYNLFRITQPYNDQDYVHSKIVIGQAFDEPKQFYNYRAIYPSKTQKIIRLFPPIELTQSSDSPERYLAFKFDSRYYRYSISRTIQVEIQDNISTTLNELKVLATLNRSEIALVQSQLDRIEQSMGSTTGQ